MKMRKCKLCGEYTFSAACAKCKGKTAPPLPPKFSPEDKYGKWRRKAVKSVKSKNNR